jgi:hypothetical protein
MIRSGRKRWMGLVARMGKFVVEQIQKGIGIEVRIILK